MKRNIAIFLFSALISVSSAEAQVVRITVAPPAPRVEVRTVAPSPRHVWVPGHWRWHGNRHDWVGGHYVTPPHAGHV
jgi:hypothetical protein